jgi:hypothetical protein
MMPKLRLNDTSRRMLRALASDTVSCPEEEAALAAAYAAAEPLVRKMVKEKYPPRDMEVLHKYGAAEQDDCIKMQLHAGGVTQFNFTKDTGPLVVERTTSGAIYLASPDVTDAVLAWEAATAALKKAKTDKLNDYYALVNSVSTMEDVEEIWPDAASVRPRLGSHALTLLSQETIARLKADIASRKRSDDTE